MSFSGFPKRTLVGSDSKQMSNNQPQNNHQPYLTLFERIQAEKRQKQQQKQQQQQEQQQQQQQQQHHDPSIEQVNSLRTGRTPVFTAVNNMPSSSSTPRTINNNNSAFPHIIPFNPPAPLPTSPATAKTPPTVSSPVVSPSKRKRRNAEQVLIAGNEKLKLLEGVDGRGYGLDLRREEQDERPDNGDLERTISPTAEVRQDPFLANIDEGEARQQQQRQEQEQQEQQQEQVDQHMAGGGYDGAMDADDDLDLELVGQKPNRSKRREEEEDDDDDDEYQSASEKKKQKPATKKPATKKPTTKKPMKKKQKQNVGISDSEEEEIGVEEEPSAKKQKSTVKAKGKSKEAPAVVASAGDERPKRSRSGLPPNYTGTDIRETTPGGHIKIMGRTTNSMKRLEVKKIEPVKGTAAVAAQEGSELRPLDFTEDVVELNSAPEEDESQAMEIDEESFSSSSGRRTIRSTARRNSTNSIAVPSNSKTDKPSKGSEKKKNLAARRPNWDHTPQPTTQRKSPASAPAMSRSATLEGDDGPDILISQSTGIIPFAAHTDEDTEMNNMQTPPQLRSPILSSTSSISYATATTVTSAATAIDLRSLPNTIVTRLHKLHQKYEVARNTLVDKFPNAREGPAARDLWQRTLNAGQDRTHIEGNLAWYKCIAELGLSHSRKTDLLIKELVDGMKTDLKDVGLKCHDGVWRLVEMEEDEVVGES